MTNPFSVMRQHIDVRWQRWIQRRVPKALRVELDQRKVFIFPTRYGFFFLLTSFLLFLGGINYENSLILNLSFFLVSLFLVAILQTFKNLSGLVLVAGETKPAFKGQDAWFEILFERESTRQYESLHVIWEGQESGSINVIERTKQPVGMSLRAIKRGRYSPGRFKVQSTFPLGLLRTWSWVQLDIAAIVYPMPVRCEYVGTEGDGKKDGNIKTPTGQDEFEYLREYRVGDSLNNIAWKKYANNRKLLSKVFHGVAGDTYWLRWGGVPSADLEMKLSMLCYWVITYSQENRMFGLSLPSGDIAPATGQDHEVNCLRALALYGVDGHGGLDGTLL